MNLPKIEDVITTARARELCVHYGYAYLVERIDAAPAGTFKEWRFDGASMTPDKLVSSLAGIPNLTEIALKHDLKYAYGELGNDAERLKADDEFKADLLVDGASRWVADIMYGAVRAGGHEAWKTSFSWGFARTDR
jgi:hypothetical protein